MEEQAESESDNITQAHNAYAENTGNNAVDNAKTALVADESGIGSELSDSLMDHSKIDMDISHATNHSSLDDSKLEIDAPQSNNHVEVDGSKNETDLSCANNHVTTDELVSPDKTKSENSFSVSGMRKDDSGIYSEKSPNGASITKENSDASLSESISESLDENLLLTSVTPMEIDALEANMNMTNNSCSQNNENNVVTSDKLADEKAQKDKLNTDAKDTLESENNQSKLDKNSENACDSGPVSGFGKVSENENNVDPTSVVIESEESVKDKTDELKCTSEDLKEVKVETGASTSDSRADKTKEQNGENVINTESGMDKDNQENKTECDNAVEAASSEQVEGQTDEKKAGEKRRTRRYVFHDGSSSSSENSGSGDEEAPNIHIRRRRRRNRLLDSDSDIDSDDDLDADKKSSSESDDGAEDSVPLTQYGPPKHKWRALYDVRNRELGYSYRKYENYFQQKVQGSLQMVQRFELQYKMDHHEGCVNALNFNRIGTLLASGSDDLNIVIWNWIENRPALIYDSGHRSNVFQSKFLPYSGDCHVVSCARDGQVRLADLSSTGVCKGTKKLAQHRGAAHKLALELDSPHVFLSCGEDAVTFEMDLRQDKPNKLVTTKDKGKKVAMYSIHSNPRNSFEFCVGGRDHYIRIYDKRRIVQEESDDNGVLKKFCPDHLVDNDAKANVTCACYNWNGTEVLGSYNDEDIYLFSNEHSDGSNYIHKYTGHRNNQTVKGVNFYGPHSEFVVSGSDCGHIFLWDKDTENIVQFMDGDDGGVINVLEPHPHAPVLATSGLDHDVKIWAPTAEKPTTLKGLNKVMKRNSRQREEEKENGGGMMDGQMLWFIMNQLRRGRRRREREENADPDGEISSDSSAEEDSDPGSDDPESRLREGITCNPS